MDLERLLGNDKPKLLMISDIKNYGILNLSPELGSGKEEVEVCGGRDVIGYIKDNLSNIDVIIFDPKKENSELSDFLKNIKIPQILLKPSGRYIDNPSNYDEDFDSTDYFYIFTYDKNIEDIITEVLKEEINYAFFERKIDRLLDNLSSEMARVTFLENLYGRFPDKKESAIVTRKLFSFDPDKYSSEMQTEIINQSKRGYLFDMLINYATKEFIKNKKYGLVYPFIKKIDDMSSNQSGGYMPYNFNYAFYRLCDKYDSLSPGQDKKELSRIMDAIDKVIEEANGWEIKKRYADMKIAHELNVSGNISKAAKLMEEDGQTERAIETLLTSTKIKDIERALKLARNNKLYSQGIKAAKAGIDHLLNNEFDPNKAYRYSFFAEWLDRYDNPSGEQVGGSSAKSHELGNILENYAIKALEEKNPVISEDYTFISVLLKHDRKETVKKMLDIIYENICSSGKIDYASDSVFDLGRFYAEIGEDKGIDLMAKFIISNEEINKKEDNSIRLYIFDKLSHDNIQPGLKEKLTYVRMTDAEKRGYYEKALRFAEELNLPEKVAFYERLIKS